MTLKTGRRCTWDEVEVGEVFAVKGVDYTIEQSIEEAYQAGRDSKVLDENKLKKFLYENTSLSGLAVEVISKQLCQTKNIWKDE